MAKFPTPTDGTRGAVSLGEDTGRPGDEDTVHRGAQETTASALSAVAARAAGQMGTENFPVALRMLPRAVGADLGAVYRFARFVDDVGDSGIGVDDVGDGGIGVDDVGDGGIGVDDVGDDHAALLTDRLAQLDAIEDDVHALAGGTSVLEPVIGLRSMVIRHGVPLAPLADLIEANRIDQRVDAYETFADLLGYCRYSAAPVGRLVLHRAGAAVAANVADSDAVCGALQVLEHCQDVGEDARAGRVYLPQVDLRRAGISTAELQGSSTSPALRRVVAIQVARSRELLRAGRPLVRRLSGWSRVAVAGYVAGGLATADALQAADFAVLEGLVRPSKGRTAWHALRLLGRLP